ncbi:hypothetical protein, partial [Rhizobium sp. Pop5]|uniref:hypothetical protein n=1 Tax=Rhizobium sp. Pop5 TaxID=1223565 RepID=UPI00196A08A8
MELAGQAIAAFWNCPNPIDGDCHYREGQIRYAAGWSDVMRIDHIRFEKASGYSLFLTTEH